jgi:hypothetical protein
VKILILCGLMMSGVHLVLGLATTETMESPIYVLIILGIGYSLLLIFYPWYGNEYHLNFISISLIVEDRNLATALGILTCVQNLSWVILPIIVAALTNADPTYLLTELFFSALCGIGVLGCLWLYRISARDHMNILEFPEGA